MKSYIITKIELNNYLTNENKYYILQPSSGLYKCNNTDIGLFDLLTMDNCNINIQEIKRCSDNIVFGINDKIIKRENKNVDDYYTLTKFVIIKNKLYFSCYEELIFSENVIKLSELLFEIIKKEKSKNTKSIINNDLIALEEKIKSSFSEPIRLKGQLKNRNGEKLSEFLLNFFKVYNINCDTIYKESMNIQCEKGKRRSIGDIYMICKYYYPNCNLREVLYEIYITLPKTLNNFRTSKCSQINKKVWYCGASSNIINRELQDEYGKNYDWYLKILKDDEKI